MTRLFSISTALLLICALLLTGCGTPEEKTLLLPETTSAEEESEESESTKDFTVKKIYAYTYETRSDLGQSAFLKGSAENEINILASQEQGEDAGLVYRQVDYRYGFYDTIGEFLQNWSDQYEPSENTGLYIEKLIPSPDGKQLLVYIRSLLWDTLFVQLYTLGTEEPWELFEGDAKKIGNLKGSFSPSGQWVTFDAFGTLFGDKPFSPIYDCGKVPSSAEKLDSISVRKASRLYPPDRVLFLESDSVGNLWDAQLLDIAGTVGLLAFSTKNNSPVFSLEYLNTDLDFSKIPFSDWALSGKNPQVHISSYLQGYTFLQGYSSFQTPYLQYTYDEKENNLYYLENDQLLWSNNLNLSDSTVIRQFHNIVWDFLRLDSGDLLAVIVQETGLNGMAEKNSVNASSISKIDTLTPPAAESYWNILSADLYLYPAGAQEGILLYKNLYNLLHMEYDEETGRILLETYEDRDLSHRRCIILEF